jgi:AmmeMemoRadiSam system protein A/AmmeMemoRadiSam system protein B
VGKICGYYAMPHPPIILPEIGRGEEAAIQDTTDAFFKVSEEIAEMKPDTIILITPHGPVFQDAIAVMNDSEIQGSMIHFRAPQVKFYAKIDTGLANQVLKQSNRAGIPAVSITKSSAVRYGTSYELDHGAMVPMYFINKKYSDYELVHITYGLLPKKQLYDFGICIKNAVEKSNRNVVFIASGDLSHRLLKGGPYEYSPYGEKFDNEIRTLLEQGDVSGIFNLNPKMIEEAGECALRSYYILLGALDGHEFNGQTLSYQGTFGVGYLVMKINIKNKQQNPYVRLARESLAHYLKNGSYMSIPDYVTQEMREQQRAVFVTLRKYGKLRGCIGTVVPVTNCVAEEIIRNAVEAGTRDPRFPPVTIEELNELDFSVDVLTEPEPAEYHELDPKKYGIIVRSGLRSGLLLPDLEGVDTAKEQLSIALGKAGISPRSPYSIERFQVIRFQEDK